MRIRNILLIFVCVVAFVFPAMGSVLFYDDFDNLTNWRVYTGTVVVGESVVTLGHPTQNTNMVTREVFGENTSMLAYGSLSRQSLSGSVGYFSANGFYQYAAFFSGKGQYRAGTMSSTRKYTIVPFDATEGNHTWGITRSPTSVVFTVDAVPVATITTNIPLGNISLKATAISLNKATTLDWINVTQDDGI